jgi:hypothetical protein
MCLNVRYPQKLVKKLPREFTAYKVVKKKRGKYYFPVQCTDKEIKQINQLPVLDVWDRAGRNGCGKPYKPYYHSFRSIAAIRAVEEINTRDKLKSGWTYIKIRIERKDVTCIGAQSEGRNTPHYQTIVSRAFTTDFEEIKI